MLFAGNLKAVLKNNDVYLIRENAEPVLLYSSRSLAREAKILQEKLTDCMTNQKTLLYVGVWHSALEVILDDELLKHLVVLQSATGSLPIDGRARLLQTRPDWEEFLRSLNGKESFEVFIHPRMAKFDFLGQLQADLRMAAGRIKTIHQLQNLWQYNARRNRPLWKRARSLSQYRLSAPPVILSAGPSLTDWLQANRGQHFAELWCADTALPAALNAGLKPALVFSIDPGFASMEHFWAVDKSQRGNFALVVDTLSYPGVWELPVDSLYSYRGSNPLADEAPAAWPQLFNAGGDVTGLMISFANFRGYKTENLQIAGNEGVHRRYVSHARGTSYFQRYCNLSDRFKTAENYFYILSARYGNTGV